MAKKSRQKPPQVEERQLSWIRESPSDDAEVRLHVRATKSLADINIYVAGLSRQYADRADRLSIEDGQAIEPSKEQPRMSWGIWYETPYSEGRASLGVLVGKQRAETNVELTLTAWSGERQKAMEPFALDLVNTEWIVETDHLGRAKKPTYASQAVVTETPAIMPLSKADLPEEMQFPDSRGTGKRRQDVYRLWRKGDMKYVQMVAYLTGNGYPHMNIDILKHDIHYIRRTLKGRQRSA